jgi:hypothetical protein
MFSRTLKTRPAERSACPIHLAKAPQFLEEPFVAGDGEHYDAALLLAIHAAIPANDALTIAVLGVLSRGGPSSSGRPPRTGGASP